MDPTERFSDRVADYVAYRPTYPSAVLDHLCDQGFLFPEAVVADIGSGTGIFSKVLLDAGYHVIGVEPNTPMRGAAEASFGSSPRFRSQVGTAETTGLADAAVDLVTAAQALHWFDHERSAVEFQRISKAPHRFATVWNGRVRKADDPDIDPFHLAYEELLQRFGIGYNKLMTGRDKLEASLSTYFGPGGYEVFTTPNSQTLDWDGFVGRLMSSSYGPKAGHPDHEAVMARLREIFDEHNVEGTLVVRYHTRAYFGTLRG